MFVQFIVYLEFHHLSMLNCVRGAGGNIQDLEGDNLSPSRFNHRNCELFDVDDRIWVLWKSSKY